MCGAAIPCCISSIEEECDQIFEMSSNGKIPLHLYCEQELFLLGILDSTALQILEPQLSMLLLVGSCLLKDVGLVNDQMLQQQTLMVEAVRQKKSAEALLESYKTQRRLTHEFTNHTDALALLLQQGDYEGAKAYLSTLTKTIAANTTIMNTHNPLLDALLSKKYEEASRKGVMVYFDLPDLRNMPMDQTDLVIVLSNLLNNAIEAAAQADPPEVYVRMRKSEDEVVLSVRNRVKKDLNLVDGQLPRISQKGAGHGFGLWNVRDVLKKYGGEYTISCRECWFRFTCTIPLRKL